MANAVATGGAARRGMMVMAAYARYGPSGEASVSFQLHDGGRGD